MAKSAPLLSPQRFGGLHPLLVRAASRTSHNKQICKIPRTEANFLLGTSQIRRTVSGNAKPKQGTMKPELKRIRKVEYDIDPNRYELRDGREINAPLCPYGNHYKWIGFDLKTNEYVRLTKSVFKLLINKIENE